jgi:hypothetical protein
VEATTYGGFPRQAAIINVLPIDHVTLQVSWVTPGKVFYDLPKKAKYFLFAKVKNLKFLYFGGDKMRRFKSDFVIFFLVQMW